MVSQMVIPTLLDSFERLSVRDLPTSPMAGRA